MRARPDGQPSGESSPDGGPRRARVLVVTAVAAEADAVQAGLSDALASQADAAGDTAGDAAGDAGSSGRRFPPARSARPGVDVIAAGVGPAAAAAATSTALTTAELAGAPYGLVLSAGIGGGFAPLAPVGAVVVAEAIVAADLGAETPDGFAPVEELGFGRSLHTPPPESARRAAKALEQGGLHAVLAPVLTVSTTTGSAGRAAELLARHPRAAAEAMEGFGVAEAAAAHGVPVLEVRAVSNPVGPRDRGAWRIGDALEALRRAFHLLTPIVEEESR
ncbi:futalosine hydrolase [Streptomyces sp. 8N616]|uniref:futalosine hydrolase n=1 Tax=Streptomyces sp. 8N616 TaxID=3457414 RepID=UPI003FD44DEE